MLEGIESYVGVLWAEEEVFWDGSQGYVWQ